MKQKILNIGAESIIFLKNNQIHKKRIKKSYRLKEIDEKLRNSRTKKEAKILEKLSSLILVPKLIKVDQEKKEIIMELIKGKRLSECLDELKDKEKMCREIGKQISVLHNNNIIHGDLTTSNMILENKKNERGVYLIDFGLSFHSSRIEDKAVDIHLLKQALEAKHFKEHKKIFKSILSGYNPENKTKILKQLKKVEKRGRYK